MEAIYAKVKKLESKETIKEQNQRKVSYTAEFETGDKTVVRIKRDDIPFEGLVVGDEYKIVIMNSQTTLNTSVKEE